MGSPFKTIERGLLASRDIDQPTPRTIFLRAGVYYLEDTIHLDEQDSYLTLSGYEGEMAVVSGGRLLDLQWTAYNVSQHVSMVTMSNENNIYGQVDNPGESMPTIM